MSMLNNDREMAEEGIRAILKFLGQDPDKEELKKTPSRAAQALLQLTIGYRSHPKEILGTVFQEDYDQMVVVSEIEFHSTCEHHLLPFTGVAHVGYIPQNGKSVGLSKIPRLVHAFARRLQLQERMTQQIANALWEHLTPLGVGVVVEAHHLCMSMRGARSSGNIKTSCLHGLIKDQPETRQEFLSLARKGG